MSALYYGAWIGQYVAREAGGGGQEEGQLLLPMLANDPIVDQAGRNLYLALGERKLRSLLTNGRRCLLTAAGG
jgi:hypothetical protein